MTLPHLTLALTILRRNHQIHTFRLAEDTI
jgi:hypothetical protein